MRKLIIFIATLLMSATMIFAGTYSGGDGSSGNPYQISNLNDLLELSDSTGDWDSYFIQTADINASATDTFNISGSDTLGFSPIGNNTTNFTGEYDGQGHTIDSLFIDRPSTNFIGLFGYTIGAVIDSIGLTNVDITGDDDVGGLVGYNGSSTISNSYSTGSVSGYWYIGGLVGINHNSTITNSYSTGSVSGNNDYVGGLVGYILFSSTVSNSYSTGSVNGSSAVGGLVGSNSSSTVSNSFWDTETSGQSSSGGGTGKTTAEMKCVFTYTDTSYMVSAGLDSAWDFVSNPNDDVNNNDYWDMDQLGTVNSDYPILSWQSGSDDKILKGAGTTGDPYQISDICELALLSNNSSYWDNKYFIQTADINASVTNTFNIFGGDTLGFLPIGNSTTKFEGEYNGQGHTIDSLYINRSTTNYIGLFGYTYRAVMDSIGLTNVSITGGAYYVGGFVGRNNNSPISNSYTTGSISGNDRVGGLVGYNYSSTITNSYSTGSVSGDDRVGGLVGVNDNYSTITNNYSTGSVNGSGNSVGGLVGDNASSTITNSYSTGSVSGTTDYVGGFVGTNNFSTITNSYSMGDVIRSSGTNTNFGGFAGANTSTIEDCYSTGSVSYTGTNPTDKGFVAYNDGGTYNDNFFDSEASNQSTDAVGSATAKTTKEMKDYNTFTDTTSSVGLDTAWDFVTNPNDDANNDDDWDMDQLETVNDGYPILSWQDGADQALYEGTQPSGNGSLSSPYQVETLDNLLWISTTSISWDKYFEQIADINASATSTWNSGSGFSPIGNNTTEFTGEYNGQGHLIDLLYIDRSATSFIGLFGYTDGAVIDSIGLTNVDITGGNYHVGGLVGYNKNSLITNSYSTGSVSATVGYVGGLVGSNVSSSPITNSYSTGSVSGTGNYVGGLVGHNGSSSTITNSYSTGNVSVGSTGSGVGGLVGWNSSSTITNSYSTGSVSGTSSVGGLIGVNNSSSTITNSYSMGDVTRSSGTNTNFGGFAGWNESSIIEYSYSTGYVYYTDEDPTDKGFVGGDNGGTYNDNFFDSEVSNQTSGTGATAKTTAEMQTRTTFTDAGWDFINETTNGTEDIWKMDGYPVFDYQGSGNVIDINVKIYLEGAYK